MTQDEEVDLITWIDATYAARTQDVENGSTNIDWAIPEYRVSFSEVCAKAEELGLSMSPVDLRLAVGEFWGAA